jgi:hypothetical protein
VAWDDISSLRGSWMMWRTEDDVARMTWKSYDDVARLTGRTACDDVASDYWLIVVELDANTWCFVRK